ncbi:sugar ABC transporter ATP-binding protein [Kaistia adipata]|uniref:sugar ABC transporter ATP-binding protein n=1 Tax=Kaistia adipata TaxID=166954 RepID=UPI00041CB376|nr:sugar ABC transporter ATP-binding protein [Kaistia adipata]
MSAPLTPAPSATATATAASPPALALVHVDKRFPGVHALKDVSIEIRPGEVVGLVGENGAGKSTLMKILSGVYQPDSGDILLDGRKTRFVSASDAMSQGIGMVFQEQSLLTNLTVGENIYLGNEKQFTRFGIVDWRALYAAASRQLAKVQIDADPRTRADDLDFAARQMVELAKALTLEENAPGHLVILLDEPTSVLERAEIDILFARVRALRARASFIFVSHRLDEVLELSDRIYVMKDGAVVAELAAAEADVTQLHHLMVGRSLQAEYYREPLQQSYRDEVVLELDGLRLGGAYRDISFKLHAGEILGIAGVVGSGREELTRTLAGFAPHDGGRLLAHGHEVRLRTPAEAVDVGVGYVPRERRVEGLVLFLPVAANITLADLGGLTRAGLIDTREERRLAEDWVKRLKVRTPGINTLCLNLSGGNQQKVVLAKWLNAQSRILILDHPTRGLDVGAKEEVYELIRAVTAEGVAVILTSDTLEETIGLSHTVLVMRDGAITHRTDASPGHKPKQVDLIGHMV